MMIANAAATFEPEGGSTVQEIARRSPYERMEGEPTLWWNRFFLYRSLGPKRSLVKAVERERRKAAALKSTKTAEKAKGERNRVGVSKSGPAHLQEVPKAKDALVVPGSWRAASVRWDWVARAAAWDEHLIDEAVDKNYDQLLADYAQKSRRVFVLNELLKSVITRLNNTSQGMTEEQANFWIARAQSLMRDIREEMATLDVAFEKGVIRKHQRDLYQRMTPENMDMLLVRVGIDALEVGDQEKARLRQLLLGPEHV